MLLPRVRSRIVALSPSVTLRAASCAAYSTTVPRFIENAMQPNDPTPRPAKPNVSGTDATPVDSMGAWDAALQESTDVAERIRTMQAPNRRGTWASNQKPRAEAMSGPRFEQTMMHLQPTPMAAIELIHKQPVRWVKDRIVSCDGGGGPLGHPRIFINTDKPEIVPCGYCGLPFAHEHHREYLKSLPTSSYPLEPTGAAEEVNEKQRVTEGATGYELR